MAQASCAQKAGVLSWAGTAHPKDVALWAAKRPLTWLEPTWTEGGNQGAVLPRFPLGRSWAKGPAEWESIVILSKSTG